jgi:hypothetical protein
MYSVPSDEWVIKGGVGIIFRLDPNRTSNDIDVTYVDAAGEHAVALEALERATQADLGDFFSFEILRVGEETDDRARRVNMLCRLGAREFARFRVDLAVPTTDAPAERVEVPALTGIEEIDQVPALLALAWPQQIAEKICALFEEHGSGFSSRARDLADLGMIAEQVDGLVGDELIHALRAEEARRTNSLPRGLPNRFALLDAQEDQWRGNWTNATRNAPISFDDALRLATALVAPLLDGSASGKAWHSTGTIYGPSPPAGVSDEL